MSACPTSSAGGTPIPTPAAAPGTSRIRRVGRGLGTTARATGRGLAGLARGTKRASRYTVARPSRASEAQGAAESGLSRLIQMHVFNTAGDAAVAISLAGSLFFAVPSGEARGQVALFLGLTMLPFAIVAPLIGPFLDRFAHGRRWAIGAHDGDPRVPLLGPRLRRWTSGSALVFAAALGVLVSSKAYGVTRAAAVPRLLPRDFTLVKANGRVSLAGIVGASISAPIAALASLAGSDWSLRYAFLLFVIATICAIRLPAAVDSSEGEGELAWRGQEGSTSRRGRLQTRIPAPVAFALRANLGPWFLSGFLLMFVAFLLRDPDVRPDSSFGPGVMIGIVVGRRRPRPHPRDADGLLAEPDHAGGGGGRGPARRTPRAVAGRRALLQRLVAGAARAGRRAGAGDREVLPGRDHPARRADDSSRPARSGAATPPASWRG